MLCEYFAIVLLLCLNLIFKYIVYLVLIYSIYSSHFLLFIVKFVYSTNWDYCLLNFHMVKYFIHVYDVNKNSYSSHLYAYRLLTQTNSDYILKTLTRINIILELVWSSSSFYCITIPNKKNLCFFLLNVPRTDYTFPKLETLISNSYESRPINLNPADTDLYWANHNPLSRI